MTSTVTSIKTHPSAFPGCLETISAPISEKVRVQTIKIHSIGDPEIPSPANWLSKSPPIPMAVDSPAAAQPIRAAVRIAIVQYWTSDPRSG